MAGADEKQALHRYLRNVRGVLAWKLEGLAGLLKHLRQDI
jgi:hypothetical protein